METEFSAFVNANDLFKFVSKLQHDRLSMSIRKNKLYVKTLNIQTEFATIEDERVTKRIANVQKAIDSVGKFVDLPDDFAESVSLCSYVCSKNEQGQITLTSVYVNGKSVTASDNARIAYATLKSELPEMLIKASEIKNLLEINPISVALTDSWLHFKGKSDCIFSIRRIKGQYPDFTSFINFKGTKVNLPKEVLTGIELADIFTDDQHPTIDIKIANDTCLIKKSSANGRIQYKNKMNYKGKPLEFSINPTFLAEMLNHNTEIILGDNKTKLNSGNFTLVTAMFG